MKKHYVRAVVDLLLQGKDAHAVLENLLKVLKAKDHERLHAQILKAVLVELEQRQKNLLSTVMVASSKDAALFKDAIEATLKELGGDLKEARFITDETLIGGFVASHKGKLINRSYKEKLVSLYRRITA